MDGNHQSYNHVASFSRIDAILAAPSGNYEEIDSLPDRDRLTYSNGFYANCSALFVDIRGSSQLPSKYKRPTLAKIYRAFISELVAVMNGHPQVREVNIVGDCVWGVFNTPFKPDIDDVFQAAFEANSMIKTLRYKMDQGGYKSPVKAGIGMAWGRALMIKAGRNGSGIADVVYMGEVVNRAANLAALGSKGYSGHALMVDDTFRNNLNEHNQGLLTRDWSHGCWSGDVISTAMDQWHRENCK